MIGALTLRGWALPIMRQTMVCGLLVAGWSVVLAGTVYGQIARDASLGQTAGPLAGPNFTIGVQNAGGQIRGNNLFHSFTEFNVNTGQTATFTGPSSIANIINRVTGQNFSNIDGSINSRSAMPSANFFLLNPNGLVVGPNAGFNIGGSLHLSTADYVRMTDGGQFFANLAKQSTLTSAPVTAFGFLGEHPTGPITVQAGKELAVSEGQAIFLRGGDISISGRTVRAPGGQIIIEGGKLTVDNATLDTTDLFFEGGDITLGGDIILSASNLARFSNATVVADNSLSIVSDYVVVQGSQLLQSGFFGTEGSLSLTARKAFFIDSNSIIAAASLLIIPILNPLSGAIAPLPQAFAVSTNLYGQRCAAQKGGQFSSFVQGARDGIPPQPGDLLQSPFLFAPEESSPNLSSQPSRNPAALRLGLPELNEPAPTIFGVLTACRS